MSNAIAPMPPTSLGANPPSGSISPPPIGASGVPNGRQTANGLLPVQILDRSDHNYRHRQSMIASPRLAPSAVTAEQALSSRVQMAPEFMHNVMATRMQRTSNLLADMPRFRNQIDILA